MRMQRPKFTALPHEVVDEHLATLSGPELKVLLVILRKSHGWNREKTTISLSSIAKIAGISSGTCSDSVKSLVGYGLIKKTNNSNAESGHCASTYEPLFDDDGPTLDSEDTPLSGDDPPSPGEKFKEERKQADEKEHTTSPTPSQEETLDPPTLIRKFGQFKNFRKPRQSDRERASIQLANKGVRLTEQQAHDSFEGYRQSAWGKEHGWPIMGWCKDPLSWITSPQESFQKQTSASGSGWSEIPGLVRLKEAFDLIGAPTIAADWEKTGTAWGSLNLAEQEKAIARVPEYDGAFMKRPLNYLRDREFDRPPRPEPKSALQRIMDSI